jgi:hypothetical protein
MEEVNGILEDLLKENETNVTNLNHLIQTAAVCIPDTIIKPGKTMKNGRSKDFWKRRKQRQISNWRKELSLLAETGSGVII